MIQTTFQRYLEEMAAIMSRRTRVGDYSLSSRVDGKCIVKNSDVVNYRTVLTTRATVTLKLVASLFLV